MDNHKIYSRNKLSQMMDQNESEVNELMKIFVQMVPTMLEEMDAASINEDWNGAADIAHKLKSSMRLWDMDILDEYVLFIENNAQELKKPQVVLDKIKFLKTELTKAIEQMKLELGID